MKYIWTLILPDNGKEVVIGAYDTEGKARGAAKRQFAPDYLSLCTYPIRRRPLKEGEQFRMGDQWFEDNRKAEIRHLSDKLASEQAKRCGIGCHIERARKNVLVQKELDEVDALWKTLDGSNSWADAYIMWLNQ